MTGDTIDDIVGLAALRCEPGLRPAEAQKREAVEAFTGAGFIVMHQGRRHLSLRAPGAVYERATGSKGPYIGTYPLLAPLSDYAASLEFIGDPILFSPVIYP